MNYELAKELRLNGFPNSGFWKLESLNPKHPTLSELIEACGEDFYDLVRFSDRWQARSPMLGNSNIGETPEEAVARLWLALNKKTK